MPTSYMYDENCHCIDLVLYKMVIYVLKCIWYKSQANGSRKSRVACVDYMHKLCVIKGKLNMVAGSMCDQPLWG